MNQASTQFAATVLILTSALLHATVNTLIKVSGDGLIVRGTMNAVAGVICAPVLLLVPLPGSDLWPILAVSVLIHALYPFFLIEAYRSGDLSTAYPLVRGIVPLLAVLIAAITLEEYPGPLAIFAIALISASIVAFAVDRGPRSVGRHATGIGFAFTTALTIAVYTVVDAAGLRIAPTPLAYIAWLFVLDGATVPCLVFIARRRGVAHFLVENWRSSLAAGILGTLTYGLALFALSLGPVGEIAALRETSILFAALLGTVILREPFGRKRIVAACVAVAGIVIMHVSQ